MGEEGDGTAGLPGETGYRRATQEEELAWVVAELKKLPLVEQGLLMQRVANGSSLKVAGLSVGIGEQAAHGRVRRAMEKLRRLAREVLP